MFVRNPPLTARVFESGDYHLNGTTTKNAYSGSCVDQVNPLVVPSVQISRTTCGVRTRKSNYYLPQEN